MNKPEAIKEARNLANELGKPYLVWPETNDTTGEEEWSYSPEDMAAILIPLPTDRARVVAIRPGEADTEQTEQPTEQGEHETEQAPPRLIAALRMAADFIESGEAAGHTLPEIREAMREAFAHEAPPLPITDDGRRLAACVNACERIPTADLERYYSTGQGLDELLEERSLHAQAAIIRDRGDLLAALRELLPYAESRAEDLEEAKSAGNEDPDYPGAAEAWDAVERAKGLLQALANN